MEPIILHDENQISYNNLQELLKTNQRVAIVQPTGTGKSMINLKYLQENSLKKCLYFTSYNSGVADIKNKIEKYQGFGEIDVKLYRNLILNSIDEKDYDIIILDEYHHCGARVTEEKLIQLLSNYPNAKIIGTTATPVRYLDEQRNMTEEIFNNVTARNMSLAYAIANDLLPSFKYITGAYDIDYENILLEFYKKADELDDNRDYLKLVKKLKQQLLEVQSLNNILKENINKEGRYIVFCESIEQINQMTEKIKKKEVDWFKDIDEDVEIYTIHSKKSNCEEELKKFNESNSKHLKLLFNVDMARESLHGDYDGVIMFRSTSSMNVYEQQLGRPLSVNGKNPVIFDFVNNIYNDFAYKMLLDIEYETEERIKRDKIKGISKNKPYNLDKIEMIDNVKKTKDILDKLNKIPVTEWDKNFEKFKILFKKLNLENYPKTKSGYIDIEPIKEQLIKENIYDWLRQQVYLFNTSYLGYNEILKFQELGFIEESERFNLEDKKAYQRFVKNLKPLDSIKKIYENSFEEQLNLVKQYIDKYYFRKINQLYTLDDFIQICSIGLFNATLNYDGKLNYKHIVERAIFSEMIKNNNDSENEYYEEYLKEEIPNVYKTYDTNFDVVIRDLELPTLFSKTMENVVLNSNLNNSYKNVLLYHYGLVDGKNYTLKEIGKIQGVTGSRIGEKEATFLRNMRRPVYKKLLSGYYNEKYALKQKVPLTQLFDKFIDKATEIIKNIYDNNNYYDFNIVSEVRREIYDQTGIEIAYMGSVINKFYKFFEVGNYKELNSYYQNLKEQIKMIESEKELITDKKICADYITSMQKKINSLKLSYEKQKNLEGKIEFIDEKLEYYQEKLFSIEEELKKITELKNKVSFNALEKEKMLNKINLIKEFFKLYTIYDEYKNRVLPDIYNKDNEKVQRK